MSSHHDHDNHSNEAKPVAFRTPLILALVTVLLLLLAVSTCDKKHDCCEGKEECSEECMKKCESGDHSGHATAEEHGTESSATPLEAVETDEHTAVSDTLVKTDTTAIKVEEHAHH